MPELRTLLGGSFYRAREYYRDLGRRRFLLRLCQPWRWLRYLGTQTWLPDEQAIGGHIPEAASTRPFGVNLSGFTASVGGLPEGGRSLARALKAAGIPFVLNEETFAGLSERETHDFPTSTGNPYIFNIAAINLSEVDYFAWRRRKPYFEERYNIAYWVWENEQFPSNWLHRFRYFNEVWAPSRFVIDVLTPLSPVPVVLVPHSIIVPDQDIGPSSLLDDVGSETFVYLFVFDFRSSFERKNPLGLIEAFRRAFKPTDEAILVIKCMAGEGRPELAQMRHAAAAANIRIVDKVVSRRELNALMNRADCYVSLHRSEGFGLTMAEAMALAKPVIATNYGGNTDFITAGNSFLVDYELVEMRGRGGQLKRGWSWAQPNIFQAADLMRFVYESRNEAAARGAQASDDIRRLLAPAVVGGAIQDRLAVLIGVPETPGQQRGDSQ